MKFSCKLRVYFIFDIFTIYVDVTDIIALTSVVKKGGFAVLVGTSAGFLGCSFGWYSKKTK